MSDLLKEAIADAKAVRETALANAKMALEEAFTPHLKSMLSAKLAEEDIEEGEHEDDEDEDMEEGMHDDKDSPRREDDDEDMEEGMHDSPRREDDDDEDMDEGIIEVDGVKYAPIQEDDVEEGMHDSPRREDDDDEDMDEELDLEAVIKELEEELNESDPGEEEESVNEADKDDSDTVEEEVVTEEEEELDEEEDLEEQSTSSGIGAGDNKVKQPSAGDEEDPGKGQTHESVEAIQNELNEYKEAVTFLRDKLHEVNILNAKLLYTNKLFKEFVLSNDQKMKIVETFDRAQTTREIKLVYSTLAESYKDNGNEKKKEPVKEFASKKSGGTAPKTKIISEESQVADRFKKLAGILKS